MARALVDEWIATEDQPADIAGSIEQELLAALGSEPCVCVGDATRGAVAIVQGSSAWALGVIGVGGDERASTIGALGRACAEAGAARLFSAGPPRWYLRSGARTQEHAAWRSAGATLRATHFDLLLDVRTLERASTADVVQIGAPQDLASIRAWLREEFSTPWSVEVAAAFERRAVFAARDGDQWVAVAAHSGHCAAAGTFGPLATRPAARGRGHGARVAVAALDDLRRRGFAQVCVPWVDPDVLRFYERIAPVAARIERALFALALR